MKERKNAFVRETTGEYIDEETGEYVMSAAVEDGRYRFYLRFIKEYFKPCNECQKELHRLITKADYLYLGNKSYEPPVELSRHWEIIEKSWVETERRPAIKADYKRCYPKNWKKVWEEVQKNAD